MASLPSSVALLVAISDLKLVTSITKAINADRPKDGPLGTIRPTSATLYARGRRYERPDAYLGGTGPRAAGAAYSADAVQGYRDRRGAYDSLGCVLPVPPVDRPAGSDDGCCWYCLDRPHAWWRYPIDPVWAHLPPVDNHRPRVRVQIVCRSVDVSGKGIGLDLFA